MSRGCFAAGEAACVSVHRGAPNSSGTNSLVDLLVFGRRAAARWPPTAGRGGAVDPRRRRGAGFGPSWRRSARAPKERARPCFKAELATLMMDTRGRLPDAAMMAAAVAGVAALKERYARVRVSDTGRGLQHGPARGARAGLPARGRGGEWPRRPRRGRKAGGAHVPRRTTGARRNVNFLAHTLAAIAAARTGPLAPIPKPVTITRFEPQAANVLSPGAA